MSLKNVKDVKAKAQKASSLAKKVKAKKGGEGGGNKKVLIILTVVIFVGLFFVGNHFDIFDDILPTAGVPAAEGEIRVHFIDVGQADSILIQSADNAVLIDTAHRRNEADLIAYLQQQGIETLDVVVGTHPHADHIGSKPGILDTFNVLEVWMPYATHNTATYERFIDAIDRNNIPVNRTEAGDIMEAGQIRMTAVAPHSRGHSQDLNRYSIVLHMQFGQTSFLFTGDTVIYNEEYMVTSGRNIRADVMQVAHHGSHTSSSEDFLDAVDAHTAVISVGAGNTYGHPHQVVLDRLGDRNMDILRTDQHGHIVLVTDGENIRRE